jgi:hypothetical protein
MLLQFLRRKGIKRMGAICCASLLVYFQFAFENYSIADANTFIQGAQQGENFGSSLLGGAQITNKQQANYARSSQSAFNKMDTTAPGGWQSGSEGYYINNNVGMKGGTAINNAASARLTLLQQTSCAPNFTSFFSSSYQPAYTAFTQMQQTCSQRVSAFLQAATTLYNQNPHQYGAFYQQAKTAVSGYVPTNPAAQTILGWQQYLARDTTVIHGIENECQSAPACDLLTPSTMALAGKDLTNTSSGLPSLLNYCNQLPAQPPVSEQALQQELLDINSLSGHLDSMTYKSQNDQSLYSTCSYAMSYAASSAGIGGMNGLSNPSSSYTQMLNPSSFQTYLKKLPGGQGTALMNGIMPMLTGNPSVFSQYFNASTCAPGVSQSTLNNKGQTVATIGHTAISNGTDPNALNTCQTTASQMVNQGWVTNTPPPVAQSGAEWIWGGTHSCSKTTNNTKVSFKSAFNNMTGKAFKATAYLSAEDDANLSLSNNQYAALTCGKNNGTSACAVEPQVLTFTDGGQGQSAAATYPATGGWVTKQFTIYPGYNVIILTVKKMNVSSTPSSTNQAASGIAAIINNQSVTGAGNGAGTAVESIPANFPLVFTNQLWYTVSQASLPPTTSTIGSTNVSTGAPSAVIPSQICSNESIGCLGTQCHGIIGNQNLHFNKAVTSSTALQQMAANMKCETGTSMAAGNCIPIIFGGNMMYCRIFMGAPIGAIAGAIAGAAMTIVTMGAGSILLVVLAAAAGGYGGGTGMNNNCCAKGMQQPTPPIAEVIQGTLDTYAIVTNQYVIANDAGAAALHTFFETAYSSFSSSAATMWSYTVAPVKAVGESMLNSLGLLGAAPAAASGLVSTATAAINLGATSAGLLTSLSASNAASVTTLVSNYVASNSGGVAMTVANQTQYLDQVLSGTAASGVGSSSSAGYISMFKAAIQSALKTAVKWVLQKIFHVAAKNLAGDVAAMAHFASEAVYFASAVMAVYSAYSLANMLASMLTQCKSEEFKLGFQRKEHLCHMVGTYCKDSLPIFGCQMTATTFCCYPSPLVNIIMSQIQDAQPQIAGGYGSPKNPNCGGLTIPELAQVNWSKVNLSAWLAMLKSSGLVQMTNSSAAAMNTPYQMAHPNGQVSPTATVPTS